MIFRERWGRMEHIAAFDIMRFQMAMRFDLIINGKRHHVDDSFGAEMSQIGLRAARTVLADRADIAFDRIERGVN